MIKKYITKQSGIKGAGKGLFTNASFKKGEVIGLAHVDDQPASEIGRNHNHNEENPTAYSKKINNKRFIYASKDLNPGEEITTNYRLQPELEQPEDFMRKGGSVLRLPNKKNSKGYSRSLSATNKLFTQNFLFAKPKSRKNKVFDPNSKYYAEGGESCPYGQVWSKKYKKCIDIGVPTYADSIAIYNNTLLQKAHYDKLKQYYMPVDIMDNAYEYGQFDNIKSVEKDHLKYENYVYSRDQANKAKLKKIKDKIKSNKNPNISYILDMITGALDINAPLLRYDSRIHPQGSVSYYPKESKKYTSKEDLIIGKASRALGPYNRNSKQWLNFAKTNNISKENMLNLLYKLKFNKDINDKLPGYITTIPYYDPIAIRPSTLLTDNEIKLRYKKYGKSGISESRLKKLGLVDDKKSEPIKNNIVKKDIKLEKKEEPIKEKFIENLTIENLPLLKPGLIDPTKDELQGNTLNKEVESEYLEEGSPDTENAMEWVNKRKYDIDWNGIQIPYRLPRFRKPGSYGDLIKPGKKRYINLPKITSRNTAYLREEQDGGISNNYIEADLNEDEIEEYRKGGYIVEEIDNYQDGGVYTVKGSKGNYKKVNGKWQVDWNRSGKYQPLSKGDVKARTAVLDKMAKPVDNGISKVSSNSSDNTRVNNIYQKPLDWSFDPKYKNNIQAFVKKSSEEKEKAIQKEKEDNKIKKGLANNEGIKETVGQYNRRKEKYDDLDLLGKMIENDPADNYKPQPVSRSPFEDSPMTGIGGAPKMILQAGKWLKPLWTGTKTVVKKTPQGIKYIKNATQPFRQATVSSFKTPLPLGKKITDATGGKLNLGNSVAAYFGADALYNQGDSNSDVVKSQSNFINNPSWNTLGDASFETGVNSLGFMGLGLGKQVFKPTYNASKNLIKKSSKLINNTYKINPFALKENPNVLAHRVQKPGQTEQYIIEQFNKPKVTDFIQSNQPGWGRAFSTDPSDMGYYTSSRIKGTRGYNEPSEILRIEIPKKKLNELSIKNYNAQREAQGLKQYNSNAPDREFILPIEDIIKSEKFTENNLDDLYDYAYAYKNKKPHWFKGYKEGGATNDYVDVDLTPEEIKDLIAQGYVIEELN